jgi:hypothetical protein
MKSNVLIPSLLAFFGWLLFSASDCYNLDEDVDCTQKRKLVTGSTEFMVNQSTIWSFNTAGDFMKVYQSFAAALKKDPGASHFQKFSQALFFEAIHHSLRLPVALPSNFS